MLQTNGVCVALIDKDCGQAGSTVDLGHGIVSPPGIAVLAKVAVQSLVSPRHLRSSHNWREDGCDRGAIVQ
jgi:hypothetical protein